jgi:hypothetical protein
MVICDGPTSAVEMTHDSPANSRSSSWINIHRALRNFQMHTQSAFGDIHRLHHRAIEFGADSVTSGPSHIKIYPNLFIPTITNLTVHRQLATSNLRQYVTDRNIVCVPVCLTIHVVYQYVTLTNSKLPTWGRGSCNAQESHILGSLNRNVFHLLTSTNA